MLKSNRVIPLVVSLCLPLVLASGQSSPPCPGFNATNNTTLACEIPTALQSGVAKANTLQGLTPTLATQLSQLPGVTALSGSALILSRSSQVLVPTEESLGTILTQRGETIGKGRWYFAVTYQRFNFSSIDGISLKSVPTVTSEFGTSGSTVVDTVQRTRIDLLANQFAALGSYGLTRHLEVTLMVPFSQVILKTGAVSGTSGLAESGQTQLAPLSNPTFLAGSATGINDVTAGLKVNLVDREHSKLAIGGDVRFPTGDASNFLGTGAYGFKPYIVFSRNGRITPNINLGYQWNGSSILSVNPTSGALQNLPSSFLYSGGIDFRANKYLTLATEFVGQAVINGPRLKVVSSPTPVGSFPSVNNQTGTYAMDNMGAGIKFNPFKGLLLTGNVLVALDEGGLRSKVVPLVGISYRFRK
jgi:hypothetical protein